MKRNGGHGAMLIMAITLLTAAVAVTEGYSNTHETQTATPSTGVVVKMAVPDTPSEAEKNVPEPPEELVSLGDFKLTAYCPCPKCCGEWAYNRPTDAHGNEIVYTAIGEVAEEGKTIAVDPSVIAYGTEVIIGGNTYVAADCGGSIKGNWIDVYLEDHDEALDFGVQYATVYVKENGNVQN